MEIKQIRKAFTGVISFLVIVLLFSCPEILLYLIFLLISLILFAIGFLIISWIVFPYRIFHKSFFRDNDYVKDSTFAVFRYLNFRRANNDVTYCNN